MTDLTIGDETFKVEVTGDATKPAVVLSSSLGADLAMWDGQVAALAKHFRVVRYDTRGHGGSGLGAAPVSLARLGKDVLAILDALEIDTAHFIGLSMGGAIGLWLLVNASERIGRAVLANTAPRLSSPQGWNGRITKVLSGGMEENAAATIERWFSPDFASREPQRVQRVYDTLRTTSPAGYAACCAALRDMDLREAIGTIRHDVLIVSGTDDQVVPKADVADFIARIAGVRHVALDARHISNIEAEAAFNTAILTFLTAKPARRAPAKRPAKAKPAPTAPVSVAKRGGASRRSNAARSPLKKAATKRTPANKAATKKVEPTRRRPPAKAAARRVPATKAAARRVPASKAAPVKATAKPATDTKKAAGKTTRGALPGKAATARRTPSVKAARGAVKKTKPRKAAPKKATKAATKTSAKGVTKKMPAARRKSAAKPRRPTGRGKR